MENLILSLATKKICIEIQNRNQEKDFISFCREQGYIVARKDETAYDMTGNRRKAIFPIYYGFVFTVGSNVLNFYSTNLSSLAAADYFIVDWRTLQINDKNYTRR